MASLTEMLQYADYMAKNKAENSTAGRLASLVQSGLSGYKVGQEFRASREKAKENALDYKIKEIDYQKKVQDIANEADKKRLAKLFLQSRGLIPLDDEQASAARSTSFDAATKTTPAPNHTQAGRLSRVVEGMDENISFNPADPVGSLKVEYKTARDKAEKDPLARQRFIEEQAAEAARREKYNRIATLLGPEEAQKYANIQPTDVEIQAYRPEMEAGSLGNKTERQRLANQRREATKSVDLKIQELQTKIKDERARLGINAQGGRNMSIYSAFHTGDQSKLDKLIQRRDALLQGGDLREIDSAEIRDQIEELKKDPKKNRSAIVELVKKLIALQER